MSSDGIGAVWTLVTAAASFSPFQEGAMTFLVDAASNGGVASLVLYHPIDNKAYRSTNLGLTWTAGFDFTANGWDPNEDARIVCGATGNLYLVGGDQLGSNQVLYSSNKGAWFGPMNNINWSPNISNSVALDDFTYGCLAIRYVPSTTGLAGVHRQLVLYGGNITVDNLVFSGYNCLFDTGTQQVSSLVAEIIQPGEVYSLGASYPPSQYAPQVIYHDAGQWLNYRLYPDCAYDVHEAARKTGSTKMWQLGGFTSSYAYMNSIDYTASGLWTNLVEYNTPAYSGSNPAGNPSGRVAAGAALLVNGNFLYFAGKDNITLSYSNDVYSSTNYGASFSYVGQAAFSPRSDFASVVLPMTNTVLVIGGAYSPTGASSGTPLNDIWMCTDGQGKTWTQTSAAGPFPPFQDAAIVALYDGQAVNASNTQTYSTLLMYTGGYEAIFSSANLGQTWSTAAAPWSLRLHGMMTADLEGFVYFTGGADDGNLWFSWNKGVSWTNLNTAQNAFGFNNNAAALLQPSSVYQNLNSYTGTVAQTGQCMALKYTANPASPWGGWHKTLVIYGGANTIGVASRPSASCVEQTADNVLYAEIMFRSELANTAWTDTAQPVVPSNTVPTAVFNSPTVLLTFRQYPSCAYDVHSLPSHPSSPAQYVLGGWDSNNNILPTYDYVQGSAFATYTFVPSWGQNNTPPAGRTAAGAAVLSNGNLLWFGGKTNSDGAANNFVNDVWYEQRPNNNNGRWSLAVLRAPWTARSDMAVAALPGTNCAVMSGGNDINGNNYNGQRSTALTAAAPSELSR